MGGSGFCRAAHSFATPDTVEVKVGSLFFVDRTDAGNRLADVMHATASEMSGFHVVGLARGGVPIAAAIAARFSLTLSSFLVDDWRGEKRHVFVTPFGDGYEVVGQELVYVPDARLLRINPVSLLSRTVATRQSAYNGDLFAVGDRVILCDDGIVSGNTVRAAVAALRMSRVQEIRFATPVIPSMLQPEDIGVDDIVFCRRSSLVAPPTGMFYRSFPDVDDGAVRSLVESQRASLA